MRVIFALAISPSSRSRPFLLNYLARGAGFCCHYVIHGHACGDYVLQQAAQLLAETLRISVANHRFEYEGKSLGVTMTFGVATYRKGETLDACIARADAALYRGKYGGRNRVMTRS
jgi:PleD family two-component response regulator